MKTNACVARTIATGVGFTEGPVIRPDGELVFVSIDQGKLYRYRNGELAVFAVTGGGPNGLTEARDGTIYVSQNGGRWSGSHGSDVTGGVQSVARDGTVGTITRDPISPNDLCFGPDGYLYVTDPTRHRPNRDDGRLWRVDVTTGAAELLYSVPWYPNGIGFGLERDALYVARTGERQIMRIPLDNGRLGKPELFAQLAFGSPDGFCFDVDGNLITAAISRDENPAQVQTYDRNGKLIDTFVTSGTRKVTNVALGPDRTLYITDSQNGLVLQVDAWPSAGLPLFPFRDAA